MFQRDFGMFPGEKLSRKDGTSDSQEYLEYNMSFRARGWTHWPTGVSSSSLILWKVKPFPFCLSLVKHHIGLLLNVIGQLWRKVISCTPLPANYWVYNLPNDVQALVDCGLLPPFAITDIHIGRQRMASQWQLANQPLGIKHFSTS